MQRPRCRPMDYDPFARGPFPVGVRTEHAIDITRHRRQLPFELWYPAAAPYAGHDGTASTQDTFTVLPGSPPLRQAAVRDAEAHPGTYPLIAFSHSSGGHRRQSIFLCTHLASHGYVVVAVDHAGNTLQDAAALARRVAAGEVAARIDPHRIGMAGHSFGDWAALAILAVERRIGAVLALHRGGGLDGRGDAVHGGTLPGRAHPSLRAGAGPR